MKGFINFIKEQGVMGLAVGFILGGAVSKVVASLVSDIINPFLGLLLGVAEGFQSMVIKIGPVEVLIGHFLVTLVDFTVIALVVYYGVKLLGLEKKGKKKS